MFFVLLVIASEILMSLDSLKYGYEGGPRSACQGAQGFFGMQCNRRLRRIRVQGIVYRV